LALLLLRRLRIIENGAGEGKDETLRIKREQIEKIIYKDA